MANRGTGTTPLTRAQHHALYLLKLARKSDMSGAKESLIASLVPETLARPSSVPAEGQVPAFDAGWNAHRLGLERETVEVLSHPGGREWALMGWDVRAKIEAGQ